MPMPPTVRVKLSSEAAEAISLTPVVVQELALRELVEHILGVTGKDEVRICELLLRGTLVSGGSRFRWQGWETDRDAVREVLATFPDPDPARSFVAANCVRAVLRGGRQAIELSRDAVARKAMFQRASFWDVVMGIAGAGAVGCVSYVGYSYRERCDRFVRELSHAEAGRIREASELVKYSTLREQIRTVAFSQMEMFVER